MISVHQVLLILCERVQLRFVLCHMGRLPCTLGERHYWRKVRFKPACQLGS